MQNKIFKNRFVLISVVFALLIIVGSVFASDQKFILSGRIKSETTGTIAPIISVRELRAGAAPKVINIAQSGRFRVELDYQTKYTITFEKEGHYSKIIQLSTTIPKEVFEKDSFFPPFPIEVFLFGKVEGAVDDFSDKPIGKVFYSANSDEFDAEVTLTDADIKEKLDLKNHAFLALVKQGDDAVKTSQFAEALAHYNSALEIKQNSKVVEKRNKIATRIKNEETIAKLLIDGQKSFDSTQWTLALASYTKVIAIDKEHSVAIGKIEEINGILEKEILANAETEKRNNQIQSLLLNAQELFQKEEWENAKLKYKEVLSIQNTNETATSQIVIINTKLDEIAVAKGEYKRLVAAGDRAYSTKEYTTALQKFEEALVLQPQEKYPKEQIDLIKRAQIDQVARNKKFTELKIEGKKQHQEHNLITAKETLNKALFIKEDVEISQWITEIDEQLARNKQEKITQEKYVTLVKQADTNFSDENYTESITNYKLALAIRANESYPLNQIKKAELHISENEEYLSLLSIADNEFNSSKYLHSIKNYQKALALKPTEQYPTEQIKKAKTKISDSEAIYSQTIASADKMFETNRYSESITAYEEAITLKSDEQYPKEQIEKAKAKIDEINKSYNNAITEANNDFNANQFLESIANYEKAIALKPMEQYPAEQIIKAKTKISDSEAFYSQTIAKADDLFDEKSYNKAIVIYEEAAVLNTTDSYPKEQIVKAKQNIEIINNEYKTAIVAADRLFNASNFSESIVSYEKAIALKPIEQYPAEQIIKAKTKISDSEALYSQTIAKADGLFDEKSYNEAIAGYKEAIEINNTDDYPKQQIEVAEARIYESKAQYAQSIKEADILFTTKQYNEAISKYKNAAQIKPSDSYANQQIKKSELQLQSIKEDYNKAIAKADDEFNSSEYLNAIASYDAALSIAPLEQYPAEQIKKAKTKISDSEALYTHTIDKADQLFETEKYNDAIEIYQDALRMKPTEAYAKGQIVKSKAKLDEIEKLYNGNISSADKLFADVAYEKAIVLYKKAILLKGNQEYPKQQIVKAQFKIEEKNTNYNTLILKADHNFEQLQYADAIENYEKALEIKSEDIYPKQQIAKAKTKISEVETLFLQTVKKADKLFELEQFEVSISEYKNALEIKQKEEYPTKQIQLIEEKLKALTIEFNSRIKHADALFLEKKFQKSITAYNLALKIKPDNNYALDQKSKASIEIEAIDTKYKTAIVQGNAQFDSEQYEKAIISYSDALLVREEDPYAKQRKQLSEDRLKEWLQAMKLVEIQVKEADEAFDKGEYRVAILLYEKVTSVMPKHKHANNRIDEATKEINLLVDSEYSEKISKFKQQAEESESNNKLQLAIQYYKKILTLEPKSKEITSQITRLQDKIELQNKEKLSVDFTTNQTLAYQAEQKGNIRNALFYYRKALGFAPKHEETISKIEELENELSKIK